MKVVFKNIIKEKSGEFSEKRVGREMKEDIRGQREKCDASFIKLYYYSHSI